MHLIFDMGGTKTRFACVEDNKIKDIIRIDTDPSGDGFAKFLGKLEEYVDGRRIESIVGGMPGELEGEDGLLRLSPNLPKWLGLPIKARMESQFECKVSIFNDAVLGGLGEAAYGSGISEGVMAYLTVSTGVNGVRIVDGRADNSIRRFEVGQLLVTEDDGSVRTLESLVGGAALTKTAGKSPREVKDQRVWSTRARHLAVGLYNICLLWDPELIIFGGSMMRDIDLEQVSDEMEALPEVLRVLPRLEKSKLVDTMGLYGALSVIVSNKK